jgi:hypothetical protein
MTLAAKRTARGMHSRGCEATWRRKISEGAWHGAASSAACAEGVAGGRAESNPYAGAGKRDGPKSGEIRKESPRIFKPFVSKN